MRNKKLLILVATVAFALGLTLFACTGTGSKTVKELTSGNGVTINGEFENGSAFEVKPESAESEAGKAAVKKKADKP